jgi:hypothetical protein
MADEQVTPRGDQPKKKSMTAEEFVTKAPLYVKVPISFYPPREISFDCWHEKCGKETSWVRTDEAVVVGSGSERGVRPADYDLKSCSYICIKCQHSVLTVVYRDMQRGKTVVRPRLATGMSSRPLTPPASVDVVTHVMKVGQYPAPSVVLPKDLERNLGEDAAQFYRRALVCRNNGFGLAAATYIRRVVEDKTNELIELAAEAAESHQLDEATVAAIRKAADSTVYTRFEDKLQYAGTVFPEMLLVGSYNPLATLFSLVSKGIHGLSEEECITIADDTSAVFEYVFAKLRADMMERNKFVERMKILNQPGKKPEASPSE